MNPQKTCQINRCLQTPGEDNQQICSSSSSQSQQVFVSNSALIVVIPRRRCQVAMESDRRRMLRRCLSDWRLWCRAERGLRELFAQQEETRYKMASLINAVATGKLKAPETPAPEQITALPETFDQSQTTELVSDTCRSLPLRKVNTNKAQAQMHRRTHKT